MDKQQLAAKIWATANELRKNIKASEYKDYILGFMFYKYLSDKEIDFIQESGGEIEDLKDDSPENMQYFQDKIGYFIKYDDLFSTWREMDTKLGAQVVSTGIENFYANLNEEYARCFYVYNQTVDTHSGVFDALDSGLSKLGENAGSRDRAVRDIVALISQIPPKSEEYDVLGYIYEYLIKQFSSEAKKDGAFYTPHELTSLMARIIADRLKDRSEIKVYDPCAGTAGLLLNIGKEASHYMNPLNIKYYGQEYITETSNLAKMNLFMQDIPVQNIIVRNADSLAEDWPYFDENTSYSPLFVDAVTANPPYSQGWNPDEHVSDVRFRGYGLAPAGKADLAFLLHCLYHVKPDGIMAIVLPHGVLFRGDTEGVIRKNLIENHNIETIIGLPSNLFFSTGIPVIVMILSKNRKEDDVLFIDASQSYEKGKNQNVLKESDVQKIFDVVKARKDVPNFARLVSKEEIIKNEYNLNIPRYISAKTEEIPYDIYSVMTDKVNQSEIDSFKEYWKAFPDLQSKLFHNESDGYYSFVDTDINEVINDDSDVKQFLNNFDNTASSFNNDLIEQLIKKTPVANIRDDLKEQIFDLFKSDLVNVYDVYQVFSDHWNSINTGLNKIRKYGKTVCRETEPLKETKKNKNTKKYEDVTVGIVGKVISLDLVEKEYFQSEFDDIHNLQEKADEKANEYNDLFEDLDEDDKQQICKKDNEEAIDTKKLTAAIKANQVYQDTLQILKNINSLIKEEKKFRKEAKNIDSSLEKKAIEKLSKLSDEEIGSLLIKQWIDPLTNDISNQAQQVIHNFLKDLDNLKSKYSNTLDQLNEEIESTSNELKKMLDDLAGDNNAMIGIDLLKRGI